MTSLKVLIERPCWTAYITRALAVPTSAAKWPTKSSSGIQAKPCSSTMRCASDGVGGPPPRSAAERLAHVIEAERGDVDEPDHVGRVVAECSHDLPP